MATALRITNIGGKQMNDTNGKVCEVCQFSIKTDEKIVMCSRCGLAYHAGCWEANVKCVTSGCDGQPVSPFGEETAATMVPAVATQPVTMTSPVVYPRAPRYARLLADGVDGFVGGSVNILANIVSGVFPGIGGVFSFIGWLWAVYYSFTKDGWRGGQSIGKSACRLMVVRLATNQPCSKLQSAVRQVLFVLGSGVVFVTASWANITANATEGAVTVVYLGIIYTIIVVVVECLLALFSKNGRRLGDRLAGTQVIEIKDYRPN